VAALDIVFLVLLALLTLRCFLKGFTGEIIALASLALGVVCAVFFFKTGAAFIRQRALSDVAFLPEIIAFTAIFAVVFIAGKLLDYIIKDIINRLSLDGLDRFLGLFLGLLEGTALLSLLLLILCAQPLFDPDPLLSKSVFARFLLPLIGLVRESGFLQRG
jgi:membrane protein required for colicin V production